MQKTPDVAPYLRPQMLSPLQPSVAQTKSSVVHEIVGASFFVFFVFLFVGVGRGEEGGGGGRRGAPERRNLCGCPQNPLTNTRSHVAVTSQTLTFLSFFLFLFRPVKTFPCKLYTFLLTGPLQMVS